MATSADCLDPMRSWAADAHVARGGGCLELAKLLIAARP